MPSYQGRALTLEPGRRRPIARWTRILQVLGVLATLVALAHVPWTDLRHRWGVVSGVRVHGAHYLDPGRIIAESGIRPGDDLVRIDPARARQALLMDSRIASATVRRGFLRAVDITVEEREPVLLVEHGVPWEIDADGVLLAPLQKGVVADVPLLIGADFAALPAGTHLTPPAVERGIQWIRALSDRELQLAGQVSEIDVSSPLRTSLTLMSGTRVLAPAWPPSARRLTALRVVLADLGQKGIRADEVDVRFRNQVIVRPAATSGAETASQRG
jgi:cell division septal protein FtsQ